MMHSIKTARYNNTIVQHYSKLEIFNQKHYVVSRIILFIFSKKSNIYYQIYKDSFKDFVLSAIYRLI